ncbi:uncharacterized protein J4E79_006405 [Alternaria viburni]|uniref:uncharacterized protein n=1 Tax=Alternaria viburni TaxID=566460 RepID=UPI0020C392E8|nr:uncharacterized protein J4E79_006405 [Alternaria viburni]KAI4658647.1 hypothetical protein J4E79_006405 [Alternaria viburni]
MSNGKSPPATNPSLLYQLDTYMPPQSDNQFLSPYHDAPGSLSRWRPAALCYGEQVRKSIGITDGRAHIDQSRHASAQQPSILSASPTDVLKLIEVNEQLSTLLTQGFGNRHDPHSDHKSEGVALHDPRYKEAEVQSGKTIASLIAAINLGKNHWHSSWDPLAEEAEKSVSPYVSGPMRIGIVGETGQGKSCLIGGLLGDEGVVQTAKSGESMTRVILEYHHWIDHDSRFKYRAIISFLPWESVQKRIETYFEHWNHGLLSHEDESEHEDEEGDQTPDPAGPDSPGADTETATGVFHALFRGDPSFEDEETMKDYLLSSERAPDVGLVPSRHTKFSPDEKHTYVRLHEKLKQLQQEELSPSAAEAILRNQLKQKHIKKAYV